MIIGDLDSALNRFENRVRTAIQDSARHSLESRQLADSLRRSACNIEQNFISHHPESRFINFLRNRVAPWNQLAQKCELASRKVARSLDSQERKRRVIILPLGSLEPLEFLAR